MKFMRRRLWMVIVLATMVGGIWQTISLIYSDNESLISTNQPETGHLVMPEQELSERIMLTAHLDLKGAPPNLNYLKTLLPKMAAAGCDSLLIEYEDMFPYKGALTNLSASNHYSPSQIRELIGWAHDLGIEVIPLVQTFGHLESALKLKEWSHLREMYEYPSELCPSHPGSLPLVTEMITQVMAYHKSSRYIHIGCDEVFHIDLCQRCRERSLSPRRLFEDHVIHIAKWIKQHYPNVQPIIWDDMMRKWSAEEVVHSQLGAHVIPMVWVYTEDVLNTIQAKWWLYAKVFRKIMVAGAFKGAGQPRSDFPHIEHTLANQRSWLMLIHKSRSTHNIIGLVLTGWSRFDHFAVLCELLPISIPSLLLNLLYVKFHMGRKFENGKTLLYKEWQESLNCPSRIVPELMNTVEGRLPLLNCNWPGVDLYRSMVTFRALKDKVKNIENVISDRHGWITRYNVIHNFTNPARIIDELLELGIHSTLRKLEKVKVDIYQQLTSYTDDHTAKEWIEDRLLPMTTSLISLNNIIDALMARKDWPRRPLENNIPIFV